MTEYQAVLDKDRICVMKNKQETMSFHSHNYYEMVYVAEGKIIHCLQDKKIEVKKGDYYIIDINEKHGYISLPGESCVIINCLFYPEFNESTLKYCKKFSVLIENYLIKFDASILKFNPTTYLFHDDGGEIFSLIQNVERESDRHRHGSAELMRCYLIEIIVTTMRKIIDDEKYIEKNSPTDYIIKYIGKNYNEKISLSDISSHLNYSLPYISMKFKEDTGFLFSEYLQKKRIEESSRLLANTSRKISDIASSVGYNDVKFFAKVFKRYMNTTPSAFRKLQHSRGE